MSKSAHKFTKLTILFTVVYILLSIGTHIYPGGSYEWIPDFAYRNQSLINMFVAFPGYLFWVVYALLTICMLLAVIMGLKAIVEADRARTRGKWVLILLTVFNFFVLGASIVGYFLV